MYTHTRCTRTLHCCSFLSKERKMVTVDYLMINKLVNYEIKYMSDARYGAEKVTAGGHSMQPTHRTPPLPSPFTSSPFLFYPSHPHPLTAWYDMKVKMNMNMKS